MKKRQVLLLAAALSVTTALASCGKKDETPEVTEPPVIDMDPGSSAEEVKWNECSGRGNKGRNGSQPSHKRMD